MLLAQALFSRPDVLLLDEPTNNLDIHSIGWLEQALNDYDATMIIISHDRHFLNQVCTHIADLDRQTLTIYPGNYDDFMLASMQARERVEAANAKARDRIAELQEFVARFSANASKARQATAISNHSGPVQKIATAAKGTVKYPTTRLMKLACKEYQNACFRTPAQKTKGYSKTAANIDAGKAKYNMSGKSSKNESCMKFREGTVFIDFNKVSRLHHFGTSHS